MPLGEMIMRKIDSKFVSDDERLVVEWDTLNNLPLVAEEVSLRSGKKVWWKCKEGHEWEAAVYSRSGGNGCPICRRKKNSASVHSLLSLLIARVMVCALLQGGASNAYNRLQTKQ